MSDEQTTPQAEPQPTPEAGPTPRTQEFSVTGDQVLDFLKKILHEGNVRRVVLKDESGKTLSKEAAVQKIRDDAVASVTFAQPFCWDISGVLAFNSLNAKVFVSQ